MAAQAQIETPSFRLIDEKQEEERRSKRSGTGSGGGRGLRGKRGEEVRSFFLSLPFHGTCSLSLRAKEQEK